MGLAVSWIASRLRGEGRGLESGRPSRQTSRSGHKVPGSGVDGSSYHGCRSKESSTARRTRPPKPMVTIRMSFFWRDRSGFGVDKLRFDRECEMPAVPRSGESVAVGYLINLRVVAVHWGEDGTPHLGLEDFEPATLDVDELEWRRNVEELGWTAMPIGRIGAAGMPDSWWRGQAPDC